MNFIHWTFVTRLDPTKFLRMGLFLKDKTFSAKYYIKVSTARDAFKPRYTLSKLHCGTCVIFRHWQIIQQGRGHVGQVSFPRHMSGVYGYVKWKNNEAANDCFKFLTNKMIWFSRSHYHTTNHGQWEKYSFRLFYFYLRHFSPIPVIGPSCHRSCCVLGMEGNS